MIPLRDDNPTFHPCVVTVGLIVVNVLVFLAEKSGGDAGMQRMIWKYGYVPAELVRSREEVRREMTDNAPERVVTDRYGRVRINRFGAPITQPVQPPVREAVALPAWINIFTCMFLHASWWHLIGNMLYLWIFGNNIEDRLGPVLFLVFYLATGVAGNLAHTAYEANAVPLVGASGAISGVMGGYILLFPHARVLAILPLGWYPLYVKVPAWIFLGVYFVFQNVFPAVHGGLAGIRSAVAFLAHIGGFVAGMALIYIFPHRRLPRIVRRYAPDPDDADIVI
jgi:membrane associated rhomboid family serine protease